MYFPEHTSDVCTKVGRQLNILQSLKKVLNYKSRMAIYKSFIMYSVNYSQIIWTFTSKKSLERIENSQKRALHFMLDDYESIYHDSVWSLWNKDRDTTLIGKWGF